MPKTIIHHSTLDDVQLNKRSTNEEVPSAECRRDVNDGYLFVHSSAPATQNPLRTLCYVNRWIN